MAAPPPGANIPCPQCATPLPLDASFCLRCGAKLARPAGAPAKPVPASRQAQTLLGVAMTPQGPVTPPATGPRTPTAGSPAASPPATSATVVSPPAATATVPDGGDGPTTPPPKRVPNAHATMMGVASPGSAGAVGPSATPAVTSPPVANVPRGATMQGVAPTTPAPTGATTGRSGGTMLGVAAPVSNTARHRKEVVLSGEPQGQPAGASAPPTTPAPTHAPTQPAARTWDEEFPVAQKPAGRGWAMGLALLVAVVLGVGAAVWYRSRPVAPPSLPATLRTLDDGGHVVALTVPGAAAGTRVRHQGVERPLDAEGRAELPVTLPADRVGELELPVDVVPPSGAPERRTVRLVVAWSATTDLSKLGEERPRVHVVFHVVRGASLWVEGTAIRVSGDTGIAEIPIAPTPAREGDGTFRSAIHVRVALPGGGSSEGRYEILAPRIALRVTQPPVSLTRDATLVVNGTAPRATRVVVNAQPATVTGETFSAVVPVNPGSNALEVVAFGAGAPATARVVTYRDITPEQYLRTNGGDRGVAALVARPTVDGARVRVAGTLVGQAIDTPEGRSIQLVVEDRTCPGGRCTAWVDVARAAPVAANAAVEVVGELRGTRSYSTASGERRTDPVIVAVSLTPRRP